MRRSFILAGVAISITMLVALFAAAQAQQPRVQVGVLECRGGASIGFIVGSVTNLGCVLRVEGMPEDRYVATIRKVGLDLGITQESALAWGVYAPVARLGPGDLSGNYAGAQGSASVGVGVGGNVRWEDRRIRSRCSRSASRVRSASMSRPDWKAWNFGREGRRLFPPAGCTRELPITLFG